MEHNRLQHLVEEQLDMFLPVDIDTTMDDILEQHVNDPLESTFYYASPTTEHESDIEQDDIIHVSYKLRKDRSFQTKRFQNKFSDAVHYMEC